eukprot:UC4_evm4s1341
MDAGMGCAGVMADVFGMDDVDNVIKKNIASRLQEKFANSPAAKEFLKKRANSSTSSSTRQSLGRLNQRQAASSDFESDPDPYKHTAAFDWGNNLVDATIIEAIKLAAADKRKDLSTPQQHIPSADKPGLNPRVRGWLKHVYRKATTKDDWSARGKGPHEWWDKYTGPPMTSFQRFDLHEVSYPLAMLADYTPAWREVYTEILDQCAERYTSYWSAVDWNTQFGEDPDKYKYPEGWKGTSIPAEVFGNYNTPGWVGNGLPGSGGSIEPDPLRADAMLFFKGWMTLLMSISERISGSGRWKKNWFMSGVNDSKHLWNLDSLANHLNSLWSSRECGLH